jgi:PAS domain S-box-containing protein
MHEKLRRRVEQGRAGRTGRTPTPRVSAHDEDWLQHAAKAGEYLSLVDLELRIVLNNRRQEGVSNAEGALATDYLDPSYHELFLDTLAAAYLSGVPQYFEIMGTGPNGESVAYRSWVVALFAREGPQSVVEDSSTLFAVISVDISHVGRVERELASQTSVLDSLARNAPDNIMILDREQRILFSNHLLDEFSAEQVLGKPAWSFLPEPYCELARAEQLRVIQTGEGRTYEAPLELAQGTRWYNTRAGPIMRGGEVERVLLISTEVTAARAQEAQAALERGALDALERIDRCILASTELDAMIEGALAIMGESLGAARMALCFPCAPEAATWSITYESRSADVPALLGATFGTTPAYREHLDQTLASSGAQLFAPPADAGDSSPFRGIRSVASMALRPRPGSVWLLSLQRAAAEPLSPHERGLLERLGQRLTDGLRNMLALRDLAQSEERFRTLVEHAPEAIIILDVDAGHFVEANGNAEKLFGMSRATLLEADPHSLAPELQPDGRRSDDLINEVLASALRGETPTFEWQHAGANGRTVLCEVRLVRLPHPERRLVRGSITDISERKRAEEQNRALAAQLAQAQKMQSLGQLTGGIAHDFNNLLTVIIGSLAMLEVEEGDRPLVREMVGQADAAAQRAAALTQRLLAFSRRQPLRPQAIDISTLLSGMELLLRRTLPESIQLSVQVEAQSWLCEADPVQLESALLNLAINARDAMPRGGTLRITAQNAQLEAGSTAAREGLAPGGYLAICVSDTGTGMTQDVLAQAFEPFFTTKGVGQGSGLGLSMVYGFAKQSGGHVRIVSTPGQGSDVLLHLPRSQRDTTTLAPAPSQASDNGTGELLLVVEDDPSVRRLVCEMLHRLGYRTLAAADGPTALQLLRTRADVALMLTDMALPGGMSGAELVGQIRAQRARLPVLFMTGYSNDAVANDQTATRGVQLLPKPFSRTALANAVLQALRGQSERGDATAAGRGTS